MITDQLRATAVQACVDYDRLCREIAEHTKAIGDALGSCPVAETGGETHLSAGYKPLGDGPDGTIYRSELELRAFLSPCSGCARAHQLVVDRKAARRQLGAVKRRLRAVAHRAATPDPAAIPDPSQLSILESV